METGKQIIDKENGCWKCPPQRQKEIWGLQKSLEVFVGWVLRTTMTQNSESQTKINSNSVSGMEYFKKALPVTSLEFPPVAEVRASIEREK